MTATIGFWHPTRDVRVLAQDQLAVAAGWDRQVRVSPITGRREGIACSDQLGLGICGLCLVRPSWHSSGAGGGTSEASVGWRCSTIKGIGMDCTACRSFLCFDMSAAARFHAQLTESWLGWHSPRLFSSYGGGPGRPRRPGRVALVLLRFDHPADRGVPVQHAQPARSSSPVEWRSWCCLPAWPAPSRCWSCFMASPGWSGRGISERYRGDGPESAPW